MKKVIKIDTQRKKSELVKISAELHQRLKIFSKRTRIPMIAVVEMAVTEWLIVSGPVYLEHMAKLVALSQNENSA